MSTLAPDSSNWQLAGEIGSGAIATVVRVVDPVHGMVYAGKLLHERHRRDEAANRRFLREAELAQRLSHENLVRVHGARMIAGRATLLMELVEGPNLADHLARTGPLPESELVPMLLGIARGLAHAHAAGVIHRDLKPPNVLLAPGSPRPVPKIADFGMARASSFAGADKGALTVLGTPQYMAPECLEPLAVDPRTDLYALGCIAIELATGAPPFGGATPLAVLEQHRNAPVPSLPESFSPGLRRLVSRLLAKAPGDRPQSAGAVVWALESLLHAGRPGVPAVPTGAALVEVEPEAVADGRCAGCGAAVLYETRVCFRCGLVQVIVELGPYSVFVTGPGQLSHKLDAELRDRLLRWLRANEAAGLDPRDLAYRIPRLPFALVTGLSERSAETLRASLARIGIAAVRARGGRLAHRGMLRKTNKLAGRTMAIFAAIFAASLMVSPILLVLTLPLLLVSLPIVYGAVLVGTSRPMVSTGTPTEHGLPAQVKARLDRLHEVVAHIAERRHREALRAVVHRVIALSRDTPQKMQPEIEAEMVHALDLAAGASMSMDKLDRDMGRPGFDAADPAGRALMHERDLWSARLLDLTATLDALAARRAAATAGNTAPDEDLDALRATVEALEEVHRG